MGDNAVKKFKVLKDTYSNNTIIFKKGSEIEAEVRGIFSYDRVYKIRTMHIHNSWLNYWIENGYLKEITDEPLDKNIVSSGEEETILSDCLVKDGMRMQNVCDNCNVARGIKTFKCVKCGKEGNNYSNGISICKDCVDKNGICTICGKKIKDVPVDDIYSKKYNIYEILTLIPNLPKDTKFNCSLNEGTEFVYDENYESLKYYNGAIEDSYTLKEILEAIYTIINPDTKENWIPIKSRVEFMQAIIDGKPIRSNMTAKYSEWEYHKNYNVDDMIDLYIPNFRDFNIQYLEK